MNEKILYIKKNYGWKIKDESFARKILRELSPFHLRNYSLQFLQLGKNPSFEEVYSIYLTDKKLKDFILSYLGPIELRFRNVLGTVLDDAFGTYGYLEKENFKKDNFHKNFLDDFAREVKRANEPYVLYYKEKKEGRFPVWVMVEMLSFGDLSKLYANLYRQEQKEVSGKYHVKSEQIFKSFFHSFTILRNTCAHHGRLYDRSFPVACAIHHSDKKRMEYKGGKELNPYMLFAMILAICHVIDGENQEGFMDGLAKILYENPSYYIEKVNFPSNWRNVLEEV